LRELGEIERNYKFEPKRYALKDLQVLGLVNGKKIKGKGDPIGWKVTEKFEKLNIVL
jgi:chromosome segregation and condensation protein ScpB